LADVITFYILPITCSTLVVVKCAILLPRDAMHKRGLCRHAVSVRLSVCLSRSWIMSKRINISSKFFHHLVATPFQFFRTKRGGDIPTGTPQTGVSNAGGVGRNRDSEPISGFTACCIVSGGVLQEKTTKCL